jgi:hypothetical protein
VERELLLMLLPEDGFPDVGVYRTQVEHAIVTGLCGCGCPTVYLEIDPVLAPRAGFHGDPLLPYTARTREGDAVQQLLVFAREGWLESLELSWTTMTPPLEFPEPALWELRGP